MKLDRWWQALGLLAVLTAFMAGSQAAFPFHPHPSTVPSKPPARPEKVIALTFDDGPSPKYTPEILSLLTRYHAHATFFVLGSEVAQYPKIVTDIVRQGSAVANHGYTHVNFFRVGVGGVVSDMEKTAALLKKDHIPLTPFYRPPYGNSNRSLVDALGKKGIYTTLWSIDTRDWSSPGTSFITKKVLANAFSGAIVLMHDSGGNRTQTVQAVAAILPVLEAEGYKFVTLPQYVKDLGIKEPTKLPLPGQPEARPTPSPVRQKSTAGPWN
ncbi:polysaccharide deacetylase family protein [Sulfobacillus harzensis]|uniref:Polysaccharide deacetylase family protein n=1 Tax=Sulfobacillus harzensis TaxID=2729629 RepID=A0A7Y0Q554_9FIRM|nr:polysaccharide deacetylase family protein [Sulfobacillus harzensis]NMP23914.1 polysaccharide deacetylase family protein [Sulfobacillus harzensis]